MSYVLTPEQAESISDVELAFSTDRLLPPIEAVPDEFHGTNLYTDLVTALLMGHKYPDCLIDLHEGFTAPVVNKCIRAHLASFRISHQEKVARVAFMLSKMARLVPVTAGAV